MRSKPNGHRFALRRMSAGQELCFEVFLHSSSSFFTAIFRISHVNLIKRIHTAKRTQKPRL